MIVLVCGFGRCGSSLTLQMLNAGGVPALGRAPSYEPDETRPRREYNNRLDDEWLRRSDGYAIKLLDPHRFVLPKGFDYRTIWLTRDRHEQARSQAKFGAIVLGLTFPRHGIRALAESYRVDKSAAIRSLLAGNCGDILELRFEALIGAERRETALSLARFVDRELDIDRMLSVIRNRGPECQPGMQIEIDLIAEAEATSRLTPQDDPPCPSTISTSAPAGASENAPKRSRGDPR